jgi:hypothetical protein
MPLFGDSLKDGWTWTYGMVYYLHTNICSCGTPTITPLMRLRCVYKNLTARTEDYRIGKNSVLKDHT